MSPQHPTIKDFFQEEMSPSEGKRLVPARIEDGDGFTAEELQSTPSLKPYTWVPAHEYTESSIADLSCGPQRVTLIARVVNIYEQSTPSKKPKAARGYFKVLAKDDTGLITVNLWYADAKYNLLLGQLVSVWTTHVSNTKVDSANHLPGTRFISLFPERDNQSHIIIHELANLTSLCRTPLGYREGKAMAGLVSLKAFVDSGNEIPDARVMVCVKRIGKPTKFTNAKGRHVEVVQVGIEDETCEAMLSLYGHTIASVATWTATGTVLLVSNPGCLPNMRRLSLRARTQVEVDPDVARAEWLRRYCQRHMDHVNPVMPEGVFDPETAETAPTRLKFTLADVDEFVRSRPSEIYMGYLSVLLAEPNIVSLYHRKQLFSNQCCNMPIYSNSPMGEQCSQCNQPSELYINPSILGNFLDETGVLPAGKVILASTAWDQLLGVDPSKSAATWLANAGEDELKYLEKRMAWIRIWALFGWAGDGSDGGSGGAARLCFLKVGCGG